MSYLQLVIIGNGGHAKDISEIIARTPLYHHGKEANLHIDEIYYLDDNPERMRTSNMDCRGLSIKDAYTKLMSRYGRDLRYLIGVNSSRDRERIANEMDSIHAIACDPIVHPTAIMPMDWTMPGLGSVIGPYCVVSKGATIGKHVHMNISSSVNQNSHVGDFSTLSPGARVCGDCTIGKSVQFGANSTVINLMNIGDNVILGAGAVVTKDLPSNCTAVGVPARVISPELLPSNMGIWSSSSNTSAITWTINET
jgi:acetyltransferase EpsM